jgi:hypothetical protein
VTHNFYFYIFFYIIMATSLCHLPVDLIKKIIGLSPAPQWFVLCKQLTPLASSVINPLVYRLECGPLLWSVRFNKIVSVRSLLRDPRVDPGMKDQAAIRMASQWGLTELVELLLQDKRVNPGVLENSALKCAVGSGHAYIVKLLLQGRT